MTAPKFGKVELLIKNNSKLTSSLSVTKEYFDDCGLMITGDYLIIIIDERNDINSTLTSTGKIFPLHDIVSYRTFSK